MNKTKQNQINLNAVAKQALESFAECLKTVCDEFDSLRQRLTVAELEIVELAERLNNAELRAGTAAATVTIYQESGSPDAVEVKA